MRAKALLPTDYLKGGVLSDLTEKGIQYTNWLGVSFAKISTAVYVQQRGEGEAYLLYHMVTRTNYILRAIAAWLVDVHSIY
jgi:hypothetical protein